MAANKFNALEKKVKKRLEITMKIANFVGWLLNEKGTITKQYTGSSHTNTMTQLVDFKNFSFFGDFGKSMMGGNDIKIFYRQGNENILVFHVYYQTFDIDEECRLEAFVETGDWLEKLKKIIDSRDKILSAVRRKEKRAEARRAKKTAEDIKLEELQEQAIRLLLL
jgi:hypothetical protein